MNQRLKKQFEFIKTLDEMKSIFRMTNLIGSERKENDAEHTFHIATMAVILHEYADEEVDLEHVIKLLLFHDIVEIDAGDTFAYDKEHNKSKLDREKKAAEHLYGLLPEDQAEEFKALWYEFEAQETPESKFALVMDRLQPVYLNYLNGGGTWKEHHVTKEEVLHRIMPFEKASKTLYEFTLHIIDEFFED